MKRILTVFALIALVGLLVAFQPGKAEAHSQPTSTPTITPICGNLTGAIYTSNASGQQVNGNIYESKTDVFLQGGPDKQGSHLPDGTYYYRVTDPSGSVILSDTRTVVVTGGVFPATGLFPFDDTPNNGGEYKVWLSRVSDFKESCTKTDNFKVRPPKPTETPVPPTPTPEKLEPYGSASCEKATITNPNSFDISVELFMDGSTSLGVKAVSAGDSVDYDLTAYKDKNVHSFAFLWSGYTYSGGPISLGTVGPCKEETVTPTPPTVTPTPTNTPVTPTPGSANATIDIGKCEWTEEGGSLTKVNITLDHSWMVISGPGGPYTILQDGIFLFMPGDYSYAWQGTEGYSGFGEGSFTIGDCTKPPKPPKLVCLTNCGPQLVPDISTRMAVSFYGLQCIADYVNWVCVTQTTVLIRAPFPFSVWSRGQEYKSEHVVSWADGKDYYWLEAQIDRHQYWSLLSWLAVWQPDFIIRDANGNPVDKSKYSECSIDALQTELTYVDSLGRPTDSSGGTPGVIRRLGMNTSVVIQRLMAFGYTYDQAYLYAVNAWLPMPDGFGAPLPTPYPEGMVGGGFK